MVEHSTVDREVPGSNPGVSLYFVVLQGFFSFLKCSAPQVHNVCCVKSIYLCIYLLHIVSVHVYVHVVDSCLVYHPYVGYLFRAIYILLSIGVYFFFT